MPARPATRRKPAAAAKRPAVAKKPTPRAAAEAAATAKPAKAAKGGKSAARAPMSLEEAMEALRAAGTAQNRKIYARHGATEPMFGVSFAVMKVLMERIGADHDLARALWATGNFDARTLALKVADPARATPEEMEAWAAESTARMCAGYVSMLAAETPHGPAVVDRWLASKSELVRRAGWGLVAQLAARDGDLPDERFTGLLPRIEREIHGVSDPEREAMNHVIISMGGRNAALRKEALAAAKRIGPLEVDHGETSCETPDAIAYIGKMWDHAKAKGFPSPTAQEMKRKPPRTRC